MSKALEIQGLYSFDLTFIEMQYMLNGKRFFNDFYIIAVPLQVLQNVSHCQVQ
jgi:hypothetical protein